MKDYNIGIYGVGNFGYAILKHLAKQKSNHNIFCYDRNSKVRDYLKNNNKHPFLHTKISINRRIKVCDDPKNLILNSDILVLAVNSYAIESICNNLKKYHRKGIIVINTAKALLYPSCMTISQLLNKKLKNINFKYIMLAGGTIANDLFLHEPLGVNIASNCNSSLDIVQNIFKSSNLKVYKSSDLLGVEYASSFKNIISILAGVINGFGYSFGSETHIISRASGEIKKLVVNYYGGKDETFSTESQCWGNDMWMSSLGSSRNRKLGVLIAQLNSFSEAIMKSKKNNMTVEGAETFKCLKTLINKKEKEFKLLNKIANLCLKSNPKKEIEELFKI